nr:rop guanine nucleotide exchange factor 14 [Ipomoea batatas]
MTLLRSRLACCTREREISFDFDEQKITTYDGLESCIKQSQSYDNESSTSRCDKSVTDSLFDDDSSSTSSNTAFMSSLSSQRTTTVKKGSHGPETWEFSASPQHFCVKEKAASQSFEYSDMEAMRVKFSKLLLGEDMTGGSNGLSTALALSNAISSLSASVFGELWKLEPLSEEKKRKWQQEMEWFLSPTNYMVELVPATQNGNNGSTFEIMTPKARPDIQMNLPALQKLDTMLIETLDSMVETEFWYSEVGSRAEGRSRSAGQSKRWWLPSPQVPMTGLCDAERKKLMDCGKLVNQIFKAAKAINENVLHEMPVPALIKDALPKSAKVNLGEDLYKVLSVESASFDDMIDALNLRSEHSALETINRLEAAVLVWKEKIAEQAEDNKSPIRTSWSFIKDPTFELDRIDLSLNHAEALLQKIKTRYPNLPHTFLDMMKIQYGKDIGHAVLEAYSRVLGNLAFTILTRIGEILQEDILSNPNSPAAACHLPGLRIPGTPGSPAPGSHRVRHSLIDQMNKVDGRASFSCRTNASDLDLDSVSSMRGLITATPSRRRGWCLSREVCRSKSPENSP